MAVQILNQNQPFGDSPHLPQNADAFLFAEVMQEERTMQNVDAGIAKWQLKYVPPQLGKGCPVQVAAHQVKANRARVRISSLHRPRQIS